jgi:uncharacterized integral membrane protein
MIDCKVSNYAILAGCLIVGLIFGGLLLGLIVGLIIITLVHIYRTHSNQRPEKKTNG